MKKFPLKEKKVEKNIKKLWIKGCYESGTVIELAPDGNFSTILYSIVSLFDRQNYFKSSELTNIQGREDPQFKFSGLESFVINPDNKELLLITGQIPAEEIEAGEDEFFYRITSKFKNFSADDVVNEIGTSSSKEFPDDLSAADLTLVAPLRINHFRLGLEFFTFRPLGKFFGFAPVVYESIYVEATRDKIIITIWSDNLRRKDSNALEKQPFYQELNELLDNFTD